MKITLKRSKKMEGVISSMKRIIDKIKKSQLRNQKAQKQNPKRKGNAYGE